VGYGVKRRSFLGSLRQRLAQGLRGITFSPLSGGRLTWFGLPDERNYASLVGDGSANSIVAATISWIARQFPEAPPVMWNVNPDTNIRQRIPRHPMVRLLTYPTAGPGNPGGYYGGVLLWMATVVSWIVDGNAYWLKVRSRAGRVVQLWYVPHWMMEPVAPIDGSEYITFYQYRLPTGPVPIPPRDVVHFRYGLDSDNPRKGASPLRSVLREIFTDEEAARFSASILKNMGFPGVILSPAPVPGAPAKTNQTEVDAAKAKFEDTFGADNRGGAMVLGIPMEIKQFGFSPQQLDLSAIRDVAEERITAALGVPAAVVGFGAGLQQTKVGATMEQLKDQAWQSRMIPDQRILGGEVQTQLVPEFETDLETKQFGFDLSDVKVFLDAKVKQGTFWRTLTDGKIAKRIEARAALGLTVDPSVDDVYIDSTATATSGSPADAGNNDAQRADELQQQVNDLQNQLAQAGG